MNDTTRIVLALVLVVAALFGEKAIEFVKNNVEIVNEPTVMVVEPSMENKELVKPIVDLDIAEDDAKLITAFYLELADVVSDNNSVIKTTEQFRNFNGMAGLLHFNSDLKGKYDSLGSDIDSAIVNAIGKQSTSIDEDKREDLSQILEAVAWSVNQ